MQNKNQIINIARKGFKTPPMLNNSHLLNTSLFHKPKNDYLGKWKMYKTMWLFKGKTEQQFREEFNVPAHVVLERPWERVVDRTLLSKVHKRDYSTFSTLNPDQAEPSSSERSKKIDQFESNKESNEIKDYVELSAEQGISILKPIKLRLIYNGDWDGALRDKFYRIGLIGDIYVIHISYRWYNSNKEAYGHRHQWKCPSPQFAWTYRSTESVMDLSSKIYSDVHTSLDTYEIPHSHLDIVELQISKFETNLHPDLQTKENRKRLGKNFNNKKDPLLLVPLKTYNLSSYSKISVNYDLRDDNKVDSINYRFDINVIQAIYHNSLNLKEGNPYKILSFDKSWDFYKLAGGHILAQRVIDSNSIEKIVFTGYGLILKRVTDTKLMEGLYSRKDNNFTYVFKSSKLITVVSNLNIKGLKGEKKTRFTKDVNIGVIDTETFLDSDYLRKIYAIGYKSHSESGEPITKTFYISSYDNNWVSLIGAFLFDILEPKHNKNVFYCHNLSGYDIVFLLKGIHLYNQMYNNVFKVDVQMKDNRVMSNTIKNTITGHKVVLRDSLNILSGSLNQLANDVGLNDNKLPFPYNFVTRETINYVGKTPSIDYYNGLTRSEYNELDRDDWSMETETLKYLEKDLHLLYDVLIKINTQLYADYGLSLIDSKTVSGLALKYFSHKFGEENKKIPSIDKASIFNDISNGYYGGITEVYKPTGENLYYYDVNSLYPYVAANNSMPSINNWRKIRTIQGNKLDLNNRFGFFECDIVTPLDIYIGVLPIRYKDGISFPKGEFTGWYFSEELKLAESLGYKIKVKQGYEFSPEENIFKGYVDYVYNKKKYAKTKTEKTLAKSMLNNLLGRFGINLNKNITRLVDEKTYLYILSLYPITSKIELGNGQYLISYSNIIDIDRLVEMGLDIDNILEKVAIPENLKFNATSVVTSAAITAYGRIHMSKLKLYIMNELKGNIYYSDTDSIVTNIKLPDSMVSPNEIGKLKLEHFIKKGIFIAGKNYCFIDEDDKLHVVSKGVNKKNLTFEDYIELLNNKSITTMKTQSIKDWYKGQVIIGDKSVNLYPWSYTKRDKIFNNGVWSDTTPTLKRNNLSLIKRPQWNLILYKNDSNVSILKSIIRLESGWFISNNIDNKTIKSNNTMCINIKDVLRDIFTGIGIFILFTVSLVFSVDDNYIDDNNDISEVYSYDTTEIATNDNHMDDTSVYLMSNKSNSKEIIQEPNLLDLDYYSPEELDTNYFPSHNYPDNITQSYPLRFGSERSDAITGTVNTTPSGLVGNLVRDGQTAYYIDVDVVNDSPLTNEEITKLASVLENDNYTFSPEDISPHAIHGMNHEMRSLLRNLENLERIEGIVRSRLDNENNNRS